VRISGTHQYADIPLRYTGDLLVKPVYSFKITDSSGKVVYQHQGSWDTFMPHTTLIYELLLQPPVPVGSYTFTGTVGPESNQQTFRFPISVGSVPPRPSTPSSGGGNGSGGSGPFGLPKGWPGWLVLVIGILTLLLIVVLLALLVRRCTHCGKPRAWGLMHVEDYREVARCGTCRTAARERRKVLLCPECYRSHVLPVGREVAPAR
jgi:hypothetical protein